MNQGYGPVGSRSQGVVRVNVRVGILFKDDILPVLWNGAKLPRLDPDPSSSLRSGDLGWPLMLNRDVTSIVPYHARSLHYPYNTPFELMRHCFGAKFAVTFEIGDSPQLRDGKAPPPVDPFYSKVHLQ